MSAWWELYSKVKRKLVLLSYCLPMLASLSSLSQPSVIFIQRIIVLCIAGRRMIWARSNDPRDSVSVVVNKSFPPTLLTFAGTRVRHSAPSCPTCSFPVASSLVSGREEEASALLPGPTCDALGKAAEEDGVIQLSRAISLTVAKMRN